MNKTKKKFLVLSIIFGVGVFGFIQYSFATQIEVNITEKKLIEENEQGAIYDITMEINNPSLLVLNAGETEFSVSVENKKYSDGVLDPFMLPALSKTTVEGTFETNNRNSNQNELNVDEVKISGNTKYDIFFTSVEIPFIYYPPENQARKFIVEN